MGIEPIRRMYTISGVIYGELLNLNHLDTVDRVSGLQICRPNTLLHSVAYHLPRLMSYLLGYDHEVKSAGGYYF